MRARVVIPVLLASVVLVAGLFWLRPASGPTNSAPAEIQPERPATAVTARANSDGSQLLAAPFSAHPSNQPSSVLNGSDASVSPAEAREAYVQNRISELNDLAMTDDNDSLNTIISELNNSDPRIRSAAVDATVQFKSRNALPALEDAYAGTEDPEEKIHIQKAIEFLSIPSGTETTASAAGGAGQ